VNLHTVHIFLAALVVRPCPSEHDTAKYHLVRLMFWETAALVKWPVILQRAVGKLF